MGETKEVKRMTKMVRGLCAFCGHEVYGRRGDRSGIVYWQAYCTYCGKPIIIPKHKEESA